MECFWTLLEILKVSAYVGTILLVHKFALTASMKVKFSTKRDWIVINDRPKVKMWLSLTLTAVYLSI